MLPVTIIFKLNKHYINNMHYTNNIDVYVILSQNKILVYLFERERESKHGCVCVCGGGGIKRGRERIPCRFCTVSTDS